MEKKLKSEKTAKTAKKVPKNLKSVKKSQKYTRKPKLSEINELSIYVCILPRENEKLAVDIIKDNKGIILSRHKGKGVSRSGILSGIGAYSSNISCIFSMARDEEVLDIVDAMNKSFDFDTPGNGKAFIIDVMGYMGAKAPFLN